MGIMMVSKPRIGISSCLLGIKVRHDGGHKHDVLITQTLGRHVEWVPVCPEFEVGMGVPRETVRLVGSPANPKMIADKSGKDWTLEMQSYANKRVRKLKDMDLSGYILKKDSPSCGMERVRIYGPKGIPYRQGRGLFAQALMTKLPLLPVEEEGRLYDPGLRENFIERVFGYHRWQTLVSDGRSIKRLVDFYSQEKLLLFAHSEAHMRRLGRIVAQAKKMSFGAAMEEYGRLFMEALGHRATTRKNTNVLQHMLGFFSKQLSSDERNALLGVIGDYKRSLVPLVVPLTLIRHYADKYDIAHLRGQSYLQPHPKELMLRNHV
jgi:uncharacterized protein YbgA (DUF1722 family)/uncharacterized protein YbbK (DUF523 family)